MNLLRLVLLASVALSAACSPEGAEPATEAVEAPSVRVATTGVAETTEPDEAAAAFLIAEMSGGESPTPRMFVTRTIDGGEAHPRITLAYMVDRDWCGSGGCTLLIFESGPAEVVQLGRITITRPPIRVLTTRTNGMPDLAVTICGGGITECGEAVLPFDGQRYASNPTMPPAHRPRTPPEGKVVISEELVRLTFAGQS